MKYLTLVFLMSTMVGYVQAAEKTFVYLVYVSSFPANSTAKLYLPHKNKPADEWTCVTDYGHKKHKQPSCQTYYELSPANTNYATLNITVDENDRILRKLEDTHGVVKIAEQNVIVENGKTRFVSNRYSNIPDDYYKKIK